MRVVLTKSVQNAGPAHKGYYVRVVLTKVLDHYMRVVLTKANYMRVVFEMSVLLGH